MKSQDFEGKLIKVKGKEVTVRGRSESNTGIKGKTETSTNIIDVFSEIDD